jgi:hypothetical protein
VSDFPEAGVDQHVWVIVGKHGNWSFYFDEQYALDNLTRTDKMWSLLLSDWVLKQGEQP